MTDTPSLPPFDVMDEDAFEEDKAGLPITEKDESDKLSLLQHFALSGFDLAPAPANPGDKVDNPQAQNGSADIHLNWLVDEQAMFRGKLVNKLDLDPPPPIPAEKGEFDLSAEKEALNELDTNEVFQIFPNIYLTENEIPISENGNGKYNNSVYSQSDYKHSEHSITNLVYPDTNKPPDDGNKTSKLNVITGLFYGFLNLSAYGLGILIILAIGFFAITNLDAIRQSMPNTEGVSNTEISRRPLVLALNEEYSQQALINDDVEPISDGSWSVLTPDQQDRLNNAALNYLANNEIDAIQMARSLQFVKDEGHPSNMCGPLSAAILRDAGLMDRYVDIHNFWLLNPRDEFTTTEVLEKYFPREQYLWYETNTSTRYYDFKEFPLFAGDFIYLFAGPRDTFEHMLTVNRVDEGGRAYTVSAKLTENGYTIEEIMLYDPNQPGVGWLYDLTDKSQVEFGNTGSGGFWLWRRLTPAPEYDVTKHVFAEELDQVLQQAGGDWYVLVKEVGKPAVYARHTNDIIHPGSVIKVPIAEQFFSLLEVPEETDLQDFLEHRGAEGRTYMQLLEAMLVTSEEEATDILQNWIEDRQHPTELFNTWGAVETTLTPRRTTVEEIGKMFEGLYTSQFVSSEASEIILELMAKYTPSDDTRLGVIQYVLPPSANFYNKRGSIAEERVVVADAAIIETANRAYIVALFGYPSASVDNPNVIPTTYESLEKAIEDAAWVIWRYISQQ